MKGAFWIRFEIKNIIRKVIKKIRLLNNVSYSRTGDITRIVWNNKISTKTKTQSLIFKDQRLYVCALTVRIEPDDIR